MAATASIIIEVNDAAATAALNRVKTEAAAIGPALQPVQRISEQTFNNIEGGALRARESAALLGEEFGVKIPRALRGTIAQASLIGPIFTAAFSGLAILGFIQIAMRAGDVLAEFVDGLMGWSKQAKETMDAQIALNKVILDTNDKVDKLGNAYRLIGLQGLQLFSEKQKLANEDLDAAKKKVSDLTAEMQKQKKVLEETQGKAGSLAEQLLVPGGLAAMKSLDQAQANFAASAVALSYAQSQVRELTEALKNAGKETGVTFSKEHAAAIEEYGKAAHEALVKVQEMISGAATAVAGPEGQIGIELRAKQEELAKILTLYGEDETVRRQVAVASVAIEKEARDKRIALVTDEAEQKLKLLDEEEDQEVRDALAHAEKMRRMEDETLSIERAAAIAIAPPWERANAAIIANYEERMARIRELVKTGDLDEQHAARMQTAALRELYAQRRDELASQMEGLFDDITSGNIGKRFLQMFKHMVFQMLATWILGMQQMRSASQGAMGGSGQGGGILGAIFGSLGMGGIFGGGGGVGPGGTPPFVGNFSGAASSNADLIAGAGGISGLPTELSAGAMSMAPLVGTGLSAGMGAGGLGTTLPSGASTAAGAATGAAGIAGILGKLFPHGLKIGGTTISGTMLATLGIGLLASTFRGGGILNAFGGAAGGALTGFAFGGPIGAIIGGIAGFFMGIFGHSTKRARLAIEANIKAQAASIEDAYNLFQTDWSGARNALEALRQQGVAALQQAGVKDISRSRVGHVDHWIDLAEQAIDTTQAERNRRSALVFGPPQFRTGGLVGQGAGGAVPPWFAASAMHFAGGGAVPAFLHAGEFVMRPEAVQRFGAGNLARMNAGGGGGDTNIYISAIDAESFKDFMRARGTSVMLKEFARAHNEGAL